MIAANWVQLHGDHYTEQNQYNDDYDQAEQDELDRERKDELK